MQLAPVERLAGTPLERHIARGNPARLFAARAELLLLGLDELAAGPGPVPPGSSFSRWRPPCWDR